MLLNNPDGFISQEFEAVFALVGMYDKGKTFILNKLTGLNFKSGKKHTTRVMRKPTCGSGVRRHRIVRRRRVY